MPILLSGSAKFLTGYTPAEFVKKAFMGVKNAAQKPVRVVLTGIAKQLSKVFEQLLQRLLPSGAGSPPPLLAPIRFGSENEKRLWVANDGTVMVKASPNQTFANYLKTTNLSDADKKKAEKLAQQISATAKTLAASTKTKQDRASLKQANELKTKIEGLEKELAKLLGVSADCAKVLVHNASAPAKKWPTCNKIPPAGHERDYQLSACGKVEYQISGNNQTKCADAVEGTVVVDCKSLPNPKSSPQLGTAPQFIAQPIIAGWAKELLLYQTIISDPCSGLTKLVIRVEDPRQVTFWQMMLMPLTITSAVELVP